MEENNPRTYCQSSKQDFLRALGKEKSGLFSKWWQLGGGGSEQNFKENYRKKDYLVINNQHMPSKKEKIAILVQNGYTLYIRFAFERLAYPT